MPPAKHFLRWSGLKEMSGQPCQQNFIMYTKEQLQQMDPAQLWLLAEQLGIHPTPNDPLDKVVYDILDREAEEATDDDSPRRRRTRIVKRDTDHVFSANGTDGENHDTRSQRLKAQTAIPTLFQDELPPVQDPAAAFPKHRGRRSKAELAAIAALQASQQEQQEQQEPEPQEPEELQEQPIAPAMVEQLQEKLNEANAPKAEDPTPDDDHYWEDDPADGTDFITFVDLPIEDQSVSPMLDMFDRPTMPLARQDNYPMARGREVEEEDYTFDDVINASGVLEIMPDGYGFLRSSDYNYLSSPDDIYVSAQQIKRYGLKTGDVVECGVQPPRGGDKFFVVSSISLINGRNPEDIRDRVAFEHLTPLFPEDKFCLCGDRATTNPSTRIVDLFAPIGKGQRALIVAQPKTGKTMLMKDIANAIAANHPEAYIMMLLIDERPEEVTDMSRTVKAEVIASTFDEPADRHVKIAGIVLEKAKRMVECGHDVVIFLDSITRLARAYNTVSPASGKVLTGGVDANALQKPKRFFGAARNIEGGGSLTIIATALTDTGSKMDEVIFEEFKGTGNSELQLSRTLSNKRIFPAIDLVQSSTRRDEMLQDETTLNRMWIIRKFIAEMNPIEAMNTVRDRLVRSRDNDEFLLSMNG